MEQLKNKIKEMEQLKTKIKEMHTHIHWIKKSILILRCLQKNT